MEILNKKISLIEQEHFRISHSDSTKKSETAHANHPNETYKSQENAVVTGDVPEPESELPIQPPVKTKRYVKEARPRQNTKSRKNYGYLHKDDILQGNRKAFYKRFMDPMEVDQGLQDETIYSGLLRINKHNRQEAYITSDSLEGDVFISSQRYRNRALEGDMVAFQLVKEIRTTKVDEQDNTKEKGKTRTHPCGVVVYILSRSPEQIFSGVLISDLNGNRNVVCKEDGKNDKEKEKSSNESLWFRPLDKRVPIIFIPASYIPLDFKYNQEYHKNILVSAEIIRWRIDSMHPIGKLIKELGPIGSFDSEEKVILTDHNIRDEKFSEEIMSGLPSIPWEIPSVEYKVRRNYSKERIFSIDPATAKDLDDALHIKPYENGMFEVGVHIADVSFFIKMGTPLDKEAYRRGTSTYLVDKVVPMLPPLLCEELCSLNPGVERLAFSVVWIMDAEGKVYNTWFGRSIINSCAKLTYEDAQSVIEGRGLPSTARLFSQSVKDVETDILYLYQLSQHMRARRFNNGALSMNSVRLSFKLDKDGNPDSVFAYESKESNRMIEEFMLCANMSVARKLYECYPDQSVLRRHAPPIERRLEEFIRFADALGYDIDGSSAGALQCSFDMIDDEDISSVLKILATKPMQRAKYFCTGSLHQSKYIHYALNTPLYTHFTSPIRRYADVVVHRQLQAALDKNDQNIMIYLALYLYRLEEKQGLIVCPAIVLQVGKEAFELLVPEYGLERRCYLDSLSLKGGLFDEEKNTITLYWNKNTMPHLQVGKLKSTDDIEEITPVEEAVPSSPSESTEALTKEPQPASVENDTSHHSEYVQKLSPFIRLQVLLQADMNTSPPIIRVYPINPFADYPKFFPR
ncbi:hypothetical protein BDF14DRAFT_1736410 [Spinellus fusiger]|nr:hypothetical protein BDF14DRAFT_1736410 [Spinellus fusiger]